MTLPGVTITETDGGLGVLPPSAGRLMAFVGAATSGPLNTPATFGRVTDLVAIYTSGPMVEAAAHYIDVTGKPACVVRSGNTVPGTAGAVTSVKTGSAVVSVHSGSAPLDDLEVIVKILTDGTQGVEGVTYQVSLDGGRNYGAVSALGTGTSIAIAEAGLTLDIATGTLKAGDTHRVRTTAPDYNDAELGTALDALKASAINWEQCFAVGPATSGSIDQLETKFAAMKLIGKPRNYITPFRMPDDAESEATYLAAFNTALGAKSTLYGSIVAGACRIPSGVSGRGYRRPFGFPVAARSGNVAPQVNIADPSLGPLPGVSITDANGNPVEHDEQLFPGLDDAKAITARSWAGYEGGVYITRPRLFSPVGSDFQLIPHRRVANILEQALYIYFVRRCSKPVDIDPVTGFISPVDASEIEAGAKAAMRAAGAGMVSTVQFVLSRTDNILSTSTISGTGRAIPLGYPEFFNINFGYYNPAIQIAA